jgi:membrane-bound serine protease (ClpP class)
VLVILGLVALLLFGLPWGLVALIGGLLLEILEYLGWKRFLRRYRLRSGPETLVGAIATGVEDCAPAGQVRVHGEIWNARSTEPVVAGDTVRITALEGLTLDVEPEG